MKKTYIHKGTLYEAIFDFFETHKTATRKDICDIIHSMPTTDNLTKQGKEDEGKCVID